MTSSQKTIFRLVLVSFYLAYNTPSQTQTADESTVYLIKVLIRPPIARRFIYLAVFRPLDRTRILNVNHRATVNKRLTGQIVRLKVKGRPHTSRVSAHLWDRPFPKPETARFLRLCVALSRRSDRPADASCRAVAITC